MSFFHYFVCALLGVDSLRGGLAEGNRISLDSIGSFPSVPSDAPILLPFRTFMLAMRQQLFLVTRLLLG